MSCHQSCKDLNGLKENIGCSAVEIVYGQTLQLPGEIFPLQMHQTSMPLSHAAIATWHIILNRQFHISCTLME